MFYSQEQSVIKLRSTNYYVPITRGNFGEHGSCQIYLRATFRNTYTSAAVVGEARGDCCSRRKKKKKVDGSLNSLFKEESKV